MLRRPMFRIGMIVLAVLVLLAAVLALTARHHAVPLSLPANARGDDAVARGGAAFAGADFGGLSLSALETHAVPWRLTAAAIALDAQAENPAAPLSMATVNRRLARYGFLVDARIANLPSGVAQPARLAPPGFTVGDIAPVGGTRVRVANLGCVACHGGVGYRADGSPDPSALWLGMPNSSINLETYTQDLYRIMQRQSADP
ncbi:MAG: hypothetical protein MUF41_03265, partial [Sphingopyxis sp.]|nr:hypothetical protein [Sphingopyxis sp.]